MHPRDVLLVLVLYPSIVAQYIVLWYATSDAFVHLSACTPEQLGGFKYAWRGWDSGVCLTEEQLWCRANGGKHSDCSTADCRAEEVRLSIGGSSYSPSLATVYTGCSQGDTDRILRLRMGGAAADPDPAQFVDEAACVPPGDKRSMLLQLCDTDGEAAARGLFYKAGRRRISLRWPPSDCNTWRSCKAVDGPGDDIE